MKTYNDQIQFDITGQTLYVDVPEGRPASITSVTVYESADSDTGTAETATTGSASNEGINTTVDATSGQRYALVSSDPRKLNVTSTTGAAIGRQLLTIGADSESEWVEITEIRTDVHLIVKFPLHNTYAIASTVQSTRIQISVDPTWVADENNLSDPLLGSPRYRVRWVYVINSSTYVLDTYFDLARYTANQHTVTPIDVEHRVPGFINRLPTYSREMRGTDLIDSAADAVSSDLYNLGREQWSYRNRQRVDELIIERTIMLWARANYFNGGGDLEQYETSRRDYYELLDKRVRVVGKIPGQSDTGGGSVRVPALPIAVR